ncbi:MAG TPA: glutamine-hydrolyzing carbamoyl-phosphate synthase small subunit [Candidatus Ornithospirochaeta avicola]|uniref:Carbamoyl phosphate synthase small chain n=1 Tax=Candidatus Ornithospirochaeta avicola TaxID=2840896 RepID=A0A9D1TNW8_9SPIO|nr:glutamine-hydrolyzing carbamoyl-phosphate synthase small subunit [Candidatus Ornithospirochaeta avicola]
MNKGILKFKDGKEFMGVLFGAPVSSPVIAEAVFNTGTPGYQEILTDPSYKGQIVILTSPMIGNYGIIDISDNESSDIKATALVVKKLYRGKIAPGRISLDAFLKKHSITGFEEADTRAMTIHIRKHGAMNAVIFTEEMRKDAEKLLSSYPSTSQIDLIKTVAVKESVINPATSSAREKARKEAEMNIAVIDYGIKESILDNLYKRNARLSVFNKEAGSKEILEAKPDLVFLSNGPGDPESLGRSIETIKDLIGKVPLCGICLGHQLITLALGAKTYKMKFGHHGANQPVKDVFTGRTFVTSQNHIFATDENTLPSGVSVWMRNANDSSVEALISPALKIKSVQFHPEGAPGPLDGEWIFDEFLELAK